MDEINIEKTVLFDAVSFMNESSWIVGTMGNRSSGV